MRQQIPFVKAQGAGNDFVLIDNMERWLRTDLAQLARVVCNRHYGVGADGLIVLEPSANASFFMRYYNADGSDGGMCGNGGRCVARFAHLKGLAPEVMRFEALDHVYEAHVTATLVRLSMKDPSGIREKVILQDGASTLTGSFLDTGSPHFVMFCENVDAEDVPGIGKRIRMHPTFSPEGTNVDFVQLMSNGSMRLRTYERGVEGETLACGTGAVASALTHAILHRALTPLDVVVRSGETLRVGFQAAGGNLSNVTLQGKAHITFSGQLLYDGSSQTVEGIVA